MLLKVEFDIDPTIVGNAIALFGAGIAGDTKLLTANILTLPLLPDGYPPFSNDRLETELKPGLVSSVITVKANYQSSSITVADSRYCYFWILSEQSQLNAVSPYQYSLVTMRDYFRVETRDFATGYTIRQVKFDNLPQYKEAHADSNGLLVLPSGWDFSFTQIL